MTHGQGLISPSLRAQMDNVEGRTERRRRSETGLDYFGARYFSGAQGRFASPDPHSGSLLHVLNPQRWNMYAYALNNPLAYTDPDGRDAIAVVFSKMAVHMGHAGVGSVHHDGRGTFADFAPRNGPRPHGAGRYGFIDYKTQITYGADGKPTKESLTALTNEIADDEQQPRDSVTLVYFKTSDAETAALDAYINNARAIEAKGATPSYTTGIRDCMSFCANGLAAAGKMGGSSMFTIPNLQLLDFLLNADQWAEGQPKPDPEKDRQPPHPRCLQDREGRCVQ